MMKKGKCIGAIAAAALIGCVSLFSACGLGEEKQEYDPNKSQVIVGLMQGGMGRAWLDEIAANYMDENPDVEIVIPDPKSSEYNNNNLQNSIETSGIDIYFVNDIYLRDFVAKGLVKDITDIVTEEDENGVSIAGKINNDMLREAFQVDGKYYALPYFMSTFNTVYDVDLFESKNLYFNALANGFVTSKTERRSAGPDGEFCEICEGNGYDYSKHVGCDDGLPATYSQFKTLLSEMRRQTITPYMWCGKHIYYQQRMLAGWWADYEGANAVIRNICFENAKIGNSRSGGLISVIAYEGAAVENIYAEVTIGTAGYSATEAGSNGVLVRSNSGTIRNCITVVEDPCWTTDRHGYIASVSNGDIEHCYAIVNYTGTDVDGEAGIVTSSLASAGDYSTSKVYENAEAFFGDGEVVGALEENGYNAYWVFDAEDKTIAMNPAGE